MPDPTPPLTQVALLDLIEAVATDQDTVTVAALLDAVGRRSFGALLLVAGLVILAPLVGDIPGIPTLVAMVVLLTAVQLLLGKRQAWLPRWLLSRRVSGAKLCRALAWMRPVARFMDRVARRRLTFIVGEWGMRATALVCVLIALVTPLMELVPFSANGAGLALAAFGLSLTARDGLLALFAHLVTAASVAVVSYWLA